MSVEDPTLTEVLSGTAPKVIGDRAVGHSWSFRRYGRRHGRPRVHKLRLLFVVLGFFLLAGASTLFGMLTAIASDLPELVPTVPAASVDSYLYDINGNPIGVLAPPDKPVADSWGQISQNMVHAIVAVEDKRFWSESGVDIRGLLRALVSDVSGGPTEGASTIPEQFVKNVREEQNHRTIFEKLIEAGLAFQLTHRWKHWEILTDYLNSIYFGNGAYGVESAARVYFGWNHGYEPGNPADEPNSGCGSPDSEDPTRRTCASVLEPWESALLAGMVANPTEFDPAGSGRQRAAAEGRRNQVLELMLQQHYINEAMYEKSINEPLPTAKEIQTPQEPAAAPYFTSWVTPLIVNALKNQGVKDPEYEAYYGNLKIRLTIDLKMQEAAQAAVNEEFKSLPDPPTASLVAIDNSDGEVRAMVSGDGDYNQAPFNLATLGYRQPGSAFKMFTLAAALSSGKYGPDSIIDSKPLTILYGPGNSEKYVVHNFDNAYVGPTSLASATAISDNSVFAQVGMDTGLAKIADFAKAMGIRTPVSQNPAMILGGLHAGVSALDMAHAYETAATGGLKVYNNTLGDYHKGAIGIHEISNCSSCRQHTIINIPKTKRVLSPEVADTIDELLHGPVDDPAGTGTAAAIPGIDVAGKTGTTSNYVDAWFVGWTPQMTVAVWVGYPNSGKPMLKNFDGGPVEGGTYPAIIWHNFMIQALQILANEQAAKNHTTAPDLGFQSVTTARQQSTSGTQNNTTTAQTQAANGTGTSQAAGNTKTQLPGTQPTAPTTKTGGTTKTGTSRTGGTKRGATGTAGTTSAGAGTQSATTTPATTTPTVGTSTSGGAGL